MLQLSRQKGYILRETRHELAVNVHEIGMKFAFLLSDLWKV